MRNSAKLCGYIYKEIKVEEMKSLIKEAIKNYNLFADIKNNIEKDYPPSINKIQALKNLHPNFPIAELITLINLQKRAINKLLYPNEWFLTDKSLQQTSHYQLAKFHANLFSNYNIIADLCCGIGSDLLYLSENKQKCYAIDSDDLTLQMCEYNMNQFQRKNIIYQNIKAESFKEDAEAIFIDPDRRNPILSLRGTKQSNPYKRLIDLNDISPNYKSLCKIIEKYSNVAVKLSPLLDYEKKIYKDYSFDFVSYEGELKECLLKTGELKSKKRAVLLSSNITFEEKDYPQTAISEVQDWLLEPDPAITRAHLVNDLAYTLKMNRIDHNISLLTSFTEPQNIYGKVYKVKEVFNYNLKTLKNYLKSNNIGIIDIKTKGFSETVENFRKKLTLKGNVKALIFIIRIENKHICITTHP